MMVTIKTYNFIIVKLLTVSKWFVVYYVNVNNLQTLECLAQLLKG